jgi:hypothetical protein
MFTELNKNHESEFENVRFCALALVKAKDEKRVHVTHLMVKNSMCHGIDGKRLHIAPCTLNDGVYQVVKCTKTIVQVILTDNDLDCFPDFDDIINTDISEWIEHKSGGIDELYTMYADIIRAMPITETLNCSFLSDVLNQNHFTAWTSPKGKQPIILISGNKKAFIMPQLS